MTSPLATAFVLIRPTTTGFGSTLKKDLEGASTAAGTSGTVAGQKWAKAFQKSEVTKVANRISAGLVAAGAASVYLAVKFQSAMEKIHTQAGVSQSQIKTLGDGVLKLAGQVGFSPDSLALSLYHVESAFQSMGITGAKALDLVKIAAEGAAVGGANLEDVTNALTAVIASGIKGAHGMAGAMGVLNATVGVGDMKMQDLAEALGTGVLAAIKGFGVNIRDAGAALAVFGDNNIRGAHAGTQLRMAVMALAAPTKAGITLLQGIGISAGRLATDMEKGGLKLALEDLVRHMRAAGISADKQGPIITQAFGKKAGVGIAILLGQMTRFESKFPDLTKASRGFGDAWKRTQATAAQQFKELGHGLEAMGVTIGQKLLPPLMTVFGFIRTHTTLVLTLAGVVGGLALAITSVSIAIRLATAAQEIWNAVMALNPVGLVIIAIAALVVAVILMYKRFKWFRDLVHTVWDAMKIGFDAVWHALKTGFNWIHEHWKLLAAILFGPIGLAVDAIVTHWKFVTKVFAVLWSWLKTAWQAVYTWIIKPIGQAAVFIFNTWKSILTGVAKLIIGIKNFFAPAVTWLVNAGKKIIAGLFGGMWNAVAGAASWVARIGGKILHAVTSFFGIHSPSTVFFGIGGNLIKGLFQGMVHGAGGLAKWVLNEISKLGGSLVSKLLGFLGFGGTGGGSPGKASGSFQQYAASIMGRFGWSPRTEMQPLIALWNRESGWNPNAQNPVSTAYGIAQFLDSTWAGYGPKTSDAFKQILYGEEYIRNRYGDPAAAWAHELSAGWYDRGGWLPPGVSLAVNRTGGYEQVIPPGGRSGNRVVLEVRPGVNGSLDQAFTHWLMDAVQVKGGGDVQVAFGTR